MRKITWAILAWTALWIVGTWAMDPASTVTGDGIGHRAIPKPPAWVLFEIWAIGFVVSARSGARHSPLPARALHQLT
jgi:hypothetical protein